MESKTLEYKREYIDEIKYTVVAFANTDGGKLYIADPNFPKPIRKIINFLVRNLNGEFFSSDEIIERFKQAGFLPLDVKKKKYGQLVIMQKA